MKHAEHEPVEIERYRPQINPRLAEIITRCIQRQPDKRFASMKLLEKALESVESEDAIT
jgi:hypothetical protein